MRIFGNDEEEGAAVARIGKQISLFLNVSKIGTLTQVRSYFRMNIL